MSWTFLGFDGLDTGCTVWDAARATAEQLLAGRRPLARLVAGRPYRGPGRGSGTRHQCQSYPRHRKACRRAWQRDRACGPGVRGGGRVSRARTVFPTPVPISAGYGTLGGASPPPVQVTLTDLPCRLPLLRRNVRANGWLGQTGVRAASRAALHAAPPAAGGWPRSAGVAWPARLLIGGRTTCRRVSRRSATSTCSSAQTWCTRRATPLGRTSLAPRPHLTSAAPRPHLGTSAAPRPHLGRTSAAPQEEHSAAVARLLAHALRQRPAAQLLWAQEPGRARRPSAAYDTRG